MVVIGLLLNESLVSVSDEKLKAPDSIVLIWLLSNAMLFNIANWVNCFGMRVKRFLEKSNSLNGLTRGHEIIVFRISLALESSKFEATQLS